MTRAAILGISLMAALGARAGAADEGALAEYRGRAARAAGDADSQRKLALWCERNGLEPERVKHLGRAMLADPTNPTARGLLGLVASDGAWRRPEALADRPVGDAGHAANLAEYRNRRDAALPDGSETADAHHGLARWCDAHGLEAEAEAHYRAVVRLDPTREQVWKHLGYRKVDGRWSTDAQRAAERAEALAQRAADRKWAPRLVKLKEDLADDARRADAESQLAAIDDPRAVRSIVDVFATRSPADQAIAVQLLGQVDSPVASRALTTIALLSDAADVRRIATETLRRRELREFAGPLIGMVRQPLRYEVRPVGGPGQPGGLFVEGEQYNVRRQYAVPLPPGWTAAPTEPATGVDPAEVVRRFGDPGSAALATALVDRPNEAVALLAARSALDPAALVDGLTGPGAVDANAGLEARLGILEGIVPPRGTSRRARADLVNEREAVRATLDARRRLANDVADVEATNRTIAATNDRVLPLLQAVTGHDAGPKPESWRAWWVDRLGFSMVAPPAQYKPTFDQFVQVEASYASAASGECFVAGTPVWTRDGQRPIDALKVGDLVLTQDESTGALGYQPILVARHNPPSATVTVRLGDETIRCTPFHRFWSVGKGWVMARALESGDRVRRVGGTAVVESVAEGAEQLVYNLDVAGPRNFFVGDQGLLVHDNSLPDLSTTRFDADE